MDAICPGCFPANPDDINFKQAQTKAIERSKQNKEPVAIYKEAGEYKLANAFQAYAAGYPVCKVVSAHHADSTE
jgi:hypothetical protein